jgi:hypothetical protein
MNISNWTRCVALGAAVVAALITAGSVFAADHVSGQVLGGGVPIVKSTVTLCHSLGSERKRA